MLINNNKQYYKFRSYGFKGQNSPDNTGEKMRYKHHQKLSDDVLIARSIIKAHDKAQNSPKTKLLQAIPSIGAAIIATSIGLAQPEKLSNKLTAGLGFLALFEGSKKLDDIFTNSNKAKIQEGKKPDSPLKTTLLSLGVLFTSAIGVIALSKKAANSTQIGKFLKKEGQKLGEEINSTRIGQFVENTFEPLRKKHSKAASLINFGVILSTITAQPIAQFKLLGDIANDIQKDTIKNYKKAKEQEN